MVKGVQKFRDHFREFTDSFVGIGGVACDEWLRSENLPAFRPTQDIDLVLGLEALRAEFVSRFWEFVNAGKYKIRERSTGERLYYRFSKPTVASRLTRLPSVGLRTGYQLRVTICVAGIRRDRDA